MRILIDFVCASVVIDGGLIVFNVGLDVGAVEVQIGVLVLEVLFLGEGELTALL